MKERIGWQTLRKGWVNIAIYITFIACIVIFEPPFIIIVLAVNAMLVIKPLLNRRQLSVKGLLKSFVIVNALLAGVWALYRYIGGLWAVIIVHVFFIALIAYSNWGFIKQADSEIKEQLDIIIEKRKRYAEWMKKQKQQ